MFKDQGTENVRSLGGGSTNLPFSMENRTSRPPTYMPHHLSEMVEALL
jgi:hypothetical protein